MSDDTIVVRVTFPDKVKRSDLNPAVMRKALRVIGGRMKKDVQDRLNSTGAPKEGEYPKRRSGDMRRAVQCVYGKKDRFWVRCQIGTIYSKDKGTQQRVKKDWYAGPLNYGRKKGDLKARANPVDDAQKKQAAAAMDTLADAMNDAIGEVFGK